MNPKDRVGMTKIPNLSVVPSTSIIEEGKAMAHGAAKYGPYNWRSEKIQSHIYIDAVLRHVMQWQDGEELDQESGVSHLSHAKAGLGVLLDSIANDSWIDTRPPKGVASQLLRRENVQDQAVAGHRTEEVSITDRGEDRLGDSRGQVRYEGSEHLPGARRVKDVDGYCDCRRYVRAGESCSCWAV